MDRELPIGNNGSRTVTLAFGPSGLRWAPFGKTRLVRARSAFYCHIRPSHTKRRCASLLRLPPPPPCGPYPGGQHANSRMTSMFNCFLVAFIARRLSTRCLPPTCSTGSPRPAAFLGARCPLCCCRSFGDWLKNCFVRRSESDLV